MHAGPGAPHGAWPLVAAYCGTRGCRGPACRVSLTGRSRLDQDHVEQIRVGRGGVTLTRSGRSAPVRASWGKVRSGQPVLAEARGVTGRLELLGEQQHPLTSASVGSGIAARPVATAGRTRRLGTARRRSPPAAIPRSTSSAMRLELVSGPGGLGDPGDDPGEPGARPRPASNCAAAASAGSAYTQARSR